MALTGKERVLDVGCGTGRWAAVLLRHCGSYHGIDFCSDLVAHAGAQKYENSNFQFSVASIESFTLDSLGEKSHFDRVLCAGVLIYLNDEEVVEALRNVASVLAPGGYAIFREPMAISQRLTIKDHFSDELEQEYNAIYRTEEEIKSLLHHAFSVVPCRFVSGGDVYNDESLNNRTETRQRWFVVERDL